MILKNNKQQKLMTQKFKKEGKKGKVQARNPQGKREKRN